MNIDSESLDHQLLALLQAVRDTQDDSARATLNERLRNDLTARAAMARLLVDEQALINRLRDDGIVSLLVSAPSIALPIVARSPRWQVWRPLSAAAAGLLIGTFCTSVVFGFFATRIGVSKKVPLEVYSSGLEAADTIINEGLPHSVGEWGADSAVLVMSEAGVQPLEGKQMLRLEPIPREKNVKNHTSRVYQVLDLGSLPMRGIVDDAEVQVTASFFAANADVASRYLIRAVVLNETPEQATRDFWSKTENDGVVSISQKFDAPSGNRGWHTFSLKIPLPRGMKSLVFILGAVPPEDESVEASVHYLDDVRISVLTSQATLP